MTRVYQIHKNMPIVGYINMVLVIYMNNVKIQCNYTRPLIISSQNQLKNTGDHLDFFFYYTAVV